MSTLRDLIIDRFDTVDDTDQLKVYLPFSGAWFSPVDAGLNPLTDRTHYSAPYDWPRNVIEFTRSSGTGAMTFVAPTPAMLGAEVSADRLSYTPKTTRELTHALLIAGTGGSTDTVVQWTIESPDGDTATGTITFPAASLTDGQVAPYDPSLSPGPPSPAIPNSVAVIPAGWTLTAEVTTAGSGSGDWRLILVDNKREGLRGALTWTWVSGSNVPLTAPQTTQTDGVYIGKTSTWNLRASVTTNAVTAGDTTVDVYVNSVNVQTITVPPLDNGTEVTVVTQAMTAGDDIYFQVTATTSAITELTVEAYEAYEAAPATSYPAENGGVWWDSNLDVDSSTFTTLADWQVLWQRHPSIVDVAGPACNTWENLSAQPDDTTDILVGFAWKDSTQTARPAWVLDDDVNTSIQPAWGSDAICPIDERVAWEVYFRPDPDMATTPGFYTLFSYRNFEVVGRHLWWGVEVASDGSGGYVHKLRRREWSNNPATSAITFPGRGICFGRWNQLVVQFEPGATSSFGNWHYWLNGRYWFMGGNSQNTETATAGRFNTFTVGMDGLKWMEGGGHSGSDPALPFLGQIGHFVFWGATQITDAEVAERWSKVCQRCGTGTSILEAA